MKQKAVILDRDGTIIVDKIYLNDPEAIEYLPGVFTALRELREAGYVFVIATNQSGVPRGLVSLENLTEIHRRIQVEFGKHGVEFLSFQYAPFMTDSNHYQRKPNPGMLEAAARDHNLDLSQCWMIGDKMTDVEAGHRAGCRSILIGTEESPESSSYDPPEAHVQDLLGASRFILSELSSTKGMDPQGAVPE